MREDQVRFFFDEMQVVDRWYDRRDFVSKLRDRYRKRAIELATACGEARKWHLVANSAGFFVQLKSSNGRFQRELFSGPIDFFSEVDDMRRSRLAARMRPGARRPRSWRELGARIRQLAGVALRGVLTLEQFEKLKRYMRMSG